MILFSEWLALFLFFLLSCRSLENECDYYGYDVEEEQSNRGNGKFFGLLSNRSSSNERRPRYMYSKPSVTCAQQMQGQLRTACIRRASIDTSGDSSSPREWCEVSSMMVSDLAEDMVDVPTAIELEYYDMWLSEVAKRMVFVLRCAFCWSCFHSLHSAIHFLPDPFPFHFSSSHHLSACNSPSFYPSA